jgi:hypothetical protein
MPMPGEFVFFSILSFFKERRPKGPTLNNKAPNGSEGTRVLIKSAYNATHTTITKIMKMKFRMPPVVPSVKLGNKR